MTLPIIALIASVVCLISSIIVYKLNNSRILSDVATEKYVNISVEQLENKVQPLIDEYNEEQKQEEIKTRKAHWKSFNKWKMQKEMMNQDAGDRPICRACYNDSLEFVIDSKLKEDIPYFKTDGGIEYWEVKEDYPLSAEQKCTVCGHVANKWEYEE